MAAPQRTRDLRPTLWREAAIILGAVVLYFGVRGLTNVYVEPAVQAALDADWLVTLMNWVYIWGHWPVIAATLLWLILAHPEGYRVTRNAMLASGAFGLVVFAALPVAPPRLASLGLVDTVTTYSSAYRVLQPQAFVNQYAAMPSLHVGWDLLMGIALITYGRSRFIRLVGIMLPMFMVISVVATANHYLVDAAAGIVLVLLCRLAVLKFEGRRNPGTSDGPLALSDGDGSDVQLPRQRSAPGVRSLR